MGVSIMVQIWAYFELCFKLIRYETTLTFISIGNGAPTEHHEDCLRGE